MNDMSIEEKLKEYILSQYKSIRDFVSTTDLPYTTVDGILKRGLAKASIGNVFRICRALNISADELANGKIVPVPELKRQDVESMISIARHNLEKENYLSIDERFLSQDEVDILLDAADVAVGIIRKRRARQTP